MLNVRPRRLVNRYGRFVESYCLHVQVGSGPRRDDPVDECRAARSIEKSAAVCQFVLFGPALPIASPQQCCELSASRYGAAFKKTGMSINDSVRTSDLLHTHLCAES